MKHYLMALALLGGWARPAGTWAAEAPATVTAPSVAEVLKVSAGETLLLVARAKGVQTYECRVKNGVPGRYEWAFTGPEADLFDGAGHRLGRHFGGPTWELLDGSSVVGTVRGAVPSPSPGAVPWLLLAAKSHGGNGALGRVTSIQRLETSGGKAPVDGAGAATLGQKLRVPYTAIYYFYGPKP